MVITSSFPPSRLLTTFRGRRPSLIWGGTVMATAMTLIGILYSLPNLSQAGNYAVIALIFVYFIPFVVTWATLMRIWVSEAQPVQTRASVSLYRRFAPASVLLAAPRRCW